MTTIEELHRYCTEAQTVGALMLTGEWGCGKTYLIEHELQDSLKKTHVILRVSLFGVASVADIHIAVKRAWLSKAFSIPNNEILKKLKKLGKLSASVAKDIAQGAVDFVSPVNINISAFNIVDIIDVEPRLNGKIVVIVFDDLERSRLDTTDVLGCINEYCENRGIKTIIVADEEWLDNRTGTTDPDRKKLQYRDIKEKLVQRTIHFRTDSADTIRNMLSGMDYNNNAYKAFVIAHVDSIIELFQSTPSDDDGTGYVLYPSSDALEHRRAVLAQYAASKPHNYRSLKCAVQDFYYIYEILVQQQATHIVTWMTSFVSYVLMSRTGLPERPEGCTDDYILRHVYPGAYDSQFITRSIKQWVRTGEWDEEQIQNEIHRAIDLYDYQTPLSKVRSRNLMSLEEEDIAEGIPLLLSLAYDGKLSLGEYVNLITNHMFARRHHVSELDIEWDRLRRGVELQMQELINSHATDPNCGKTIDECNRRYFTEEELEIYDTIEQFCNMRRLQYEYNRQQYIQAMRSASVDGLRAMLGTEMYLFDEDMTQATMEGLERFLNNDKGSFIYCFKEIWRCSLQLPYFDKEHSRRSFDALRDQLQDYIDGCERNNFPIRKYYATAMLEAVQELMDQMSQDDNAIQTE